MDRIDRDILRELKKNPTKPFLKIAEEIGISPNTVQNRYEKMKKEDIIFGAFIIIDLWKIGYQGKAFLMVTNSNIYDAKTTVQALYQIPNVFFISEIIGAFDVLAMVAFRDIVEIKEIVNKIRALPSVQKVEVTLTDDMYYPVRKEYGNIHLF
jgi:DNA-binding Lrp family transcriptional regulator